MAAPRLSQGTYRTPAHGSRVQYVPQPSLVCVSISQQVRTPPQRDESLGAGESAGDCRAVSDVTVTDVWGARYGISLRLFSLVAEWSLELYFNPKWTEEKSWLVNNNVIRWIKELSCWLVVKHIQTV